MEIPVPPTEMRALVGVSDQGQFDNPTGCNVLPEAGDCSYGDVLDFGCGCGRLARQFLQQHPQPMRYVGVDLHAGMVRWCQENLAPVAPQFSFVHHDVFGAGYNPEASAKVLELPVHSDSFDLVVAVFTHLADRDTAVWYLGEFKRVLKPGGMLLGTWPRAFEA
jgi:SAM-dependent methyltransferase